ncbi:hypothetical protein HRbin17_02004 [bacterium HR17]|uniref:Uncharacterized protein n=1 Tax=Candidatus Fervidibacter japonicus TaxID=2035412 RepID=A0A2H5XE70_9BACT|nr:hypothetical protein HRbin17_02004 [bacterium HR17]
MMAKVAKSVMLGVALTVMAVMMQRVWSGAPQDPLAEWAYPKAKRGAEGTNQPPLLWTKLTTTDPFEKVWEFYWKKVSRGMTTGLPKIKSGTFYAGTEKEKIVSAYFGDDNPAGKLGVFVIREEKRTVSVTIMQRAKEKVTTIIVAVDQR